MPRLRPTAHDCRLARSFTRLPCSSRCSARVGAVRPLVAHAGNPHRSTRSISAASAFWVCPGGRGSPRRQRRTNAVEPLPASYHEFEDLLSGTAAIYTGPATGPANVKSAGHAFVTRVLVRAPVSAAHFSGSVWVEPFNTSGGGDFDAVWATIAPLIEGQGDAWVGVTVRANQVRNLRRFDPVRSRGISLNSNAYTWDALRDVGALLKTNAPQSPLHALAVKRVYLGGYSQSGVDVATFVAALDRITRLRDGRLCMTAISSVRTTGI